MHANTANPSFRPAPGRAWLAALALAACSSAAWAQTGVAAQRSGAAADAAARYQREVADCKSGKSHQDVETCLREARNAQAEARRGQLAGGAPDASSATRRCEALPADQRDDCRARVLQGTSSGSVESGGILREHRTIVPAPVSAPSPTPAASAASR